MAYSQLGHSVMVWNESYSNCFDRLFIAWWFVCLAPFAVCFIAEAKQVPEKKRKSFSLRNVLNVIFGLHTIQNRTKHNETKMWTNKNFNSKYCSKEINWMSKKTIGLRHWMSELSSDKWPICVSLFYRLFALILPFFHWIRQFLLFDKKWSVVLMCHLCVNPFIVLNFQRFFAPHFKTSNTEKRDQYLLIFRFLACIFFVSILFISSSM